jgi:hypothetical protein
MRKKIIIVSLLLLIAPTILLAAFNQATLTDGLHRVVAKSEAQAKYLFSLGYKLETKVGSLTGPIINSNFVTIGGITEYYWSSSLKTATTTVCAIKSPVGTSSLIFASASFTTSTTSASVVTFAKAATAYATTTAIGTTFSIAANAQASLIATTTSNNATVQFAPSQYLVVGMQGNPGTYSPVGKCEAIFRVTY